MQIAVMGKDISRIAKANSVSSSVRSTIPSRIVEGLKLEIGDAIEWELYTDSKGEPRANVRKLK